MRFYELIFIIRQDISFNEVERITEGITKILTDNDSTVISNEYWGFRSLSYEILNNKKGHYVFLGIQATIVAINELKRKIKLNEEIIRSLIIRVKDISPNPSSMLKQLRSQQSTVAEETN